jgi:hypothetical protein
MQGLTMKSLKHHVALQPLFVIIGAGMVFVGAYVFRSATKGLLFANFFYIFLYFLYRYTVTYLFVTCRVVSRTPCTVDTSEGSLGRHQVVVLLAGTVRLTFHLFILR